MATQNSSMAALASRICNQIGSIFSKDTSPHPPALEVMLSTRAVQKGRVFLYGVGREGLMFKALCMRLAHLGLPAHFVFDMNTPQSPCLFCLRWWGINWEKSWDRAKKPSDLAMPIWNE